MQLGVQDVQLHTSFLASSFFKDLLENLDLHNQLHTHILVASTAPAEQLHKPFYVVIKDPNEMIIIT